MSPLYIILPFVIHSARTLAVKLEISLFNFGEIYFTGIICISKKVKGYRIVVERNHLDKPNFVSKFDCVLVGMQILGKSL